MSRRRLRPEEQELWQKVTHSTTPLPQALRRVEKPQKPQVRRKPEPEPMDLSKAFGIGRHPERSKSSVTTPQPAAPKKPVMDKKTFGRMRRGKLVPEARIDLHGMTLDQAHPALTKFILTSYSRGFRLVLVITGKGQRDDPHDPIPRQRGILKRQVPMWLKMAPLNTAVMDVAEAHIRHGGGGAYYVYLRRTARS
ncbi:Smr/MutS family protein [Marivita sp. XM-24bin2]|jgi:DNA-nicking Smr family endonuclease|uniref:Smr/MutS family protein n=1 Tax=unclassified Marivita TaxID=2632480 RepID=UPI000D7A700B|nr:Smr/MutS family protein [Marivita sp. XM-24bin2]MCR9110793.1 Smr/MutS family protein [Paracoccaceae bacterium]PWL34534.1 MAG: DNA mismatch repair protein MutS [Marivita sp. XM-24bin2]